MAATSPARLVLICGLPAAGKSTLARELASRIPAVRLDKDEWVRQLGQDVWDDAFRLRIEAQLWELARQLLSAGTSVILEWGHWSRAERDAKRLGARALDAGVELHFLDVPFAELIDRVERRERSGEWTDAPISREQMREWETSFERPGEDERRLYDPPLHTVPMSHSPTSSTS